MNQFSTSSKLQQLISDSPFNLLAVNCLTWNLRGHLNHLVSRHCWSPRRERGQETTVKGTEMHGPESSMGWLEYFLQFAGWQSIEVFFLFFFAGVWTNWWLWCVLINLVCLFRHSQPFTGHSSVACVRVSYIWSTWTLSTWMKVLGVPKIIISD